MEDWLPPFSFQKLIVPQCVECRGKDPHAQYEGSTKIKKSSIRKKSNKQTLKGNKQINCHKPGNEQNNTENKQGDRTTYTLSADEGMTGGELHRGESN